MFLTAVKSRRGIVVRSLAVGLLPVVAMSCSDRVSRSSEPKFRVDQRAFYFKGDDIGYPRILIRMPRSEAAVRTLSRVMIRYVFVDLYGVEHTVAEKQKDAFNYPSYISPVTEFGDDAYLLYVDAYIRPKHRKTLLRILVEELSLSKLPVLEVTVPPPEGDFWRKAVGPTAFELLGDVPYDGWRPDDLINRTSIPS